MSKVYAEIDPVAFTKLVESQRDNFATFAVIWDVIDDNPMLLWPIVLRRLHPATASLLRSATKVKFSHLNKAMTIRFDPEHSFQAYMACRPKTLHQVNEVLREVVGLSGWNIRVYHKKQDITGADWPF